MTGSITPPAALAAPPAERIGILAVHGMGEQKPGEFAANFAGTIGDAIRGANPGALLQYETKATGGADVVLYVDPGGSGVARGRTPCEVHVYEAYWADLDDEPSLRGTIEFWLWGCSIWMHRGRRDLQRELPGTQGSMKAVVPKIGVRERAQLFGAAFMFCLIACTLQLMLRLLYLTPWVGSTIKAALGRVFAGTGPIELIVSYMGDVKLYQDDREAVRPLERARARPRVAIRRRAIRRMIDVATAGYDRWYVAAHSLGTVVALDALNETAGALPNYLDAQRCEKLRSAGWLVHDAAKFKANPMRPSRPAYVGSHEFLERSKLFGTLRGFVTYGSPIDKFAALFSWISAINTERRVFRSDFEWINLFERNDPVAGHLEFASMTHAIAENSADPAPNNRGYDAAPFGFVGLTHTGYLRSPRSPRSVARAITDWLLNPRNKFPFGQTDFIQGSDKAEPSRMWLHVQLVLIALLGVAASGLSGAGLLKLLLGGSVEAFAAPAFFVLAAMFAAAVTVASLLIVVGAGLWRAARLSK